MIDVEALKARFDCRDVVERDLGPPYHRGSRENRYKCPLHNEQKGYSLAVYAGHWRCYGKCATGGDVIRWVQAYHNLDFQAACEYLSAGELPRSTGSISPEPQRTAQAYSEPPLADWQAAARAVAEQAQEILWQPGQRAALEYLLVDRGLKQEAILMGRLGFIPGQPHEWRTIEGLNVPCGITLPWYAGGALWGIKVRRLGGEQRYQQVAGGNIRGSLYLVDEINRGLPLLITEGEFDALIVWQLAREMVSPLSIGSAANRHINIRWWREMIGAPRVLARMDNDEAGQQAFAALEGLSGSVRWTQVPVGKDINDLYLEAGKARVIAWLQEALREN